MNTRPNKCLVVLKHLKQMSHSYLFQWWWISNISEGHILIYFNIVIFLRYTSIIQDLIVILILI